MDISYSNSIQEDERMVVRVLPKNLLEQFACSRENQFVCWYLAILTGQGDIKEVSWCSNLKGDIAVQNCPAITISNSLFGLFVLMTFCLFDIDFLSFTFSFSFLTVSLFDFLSFCLYDFMCLQIVDLLCFANFWLFFFSFLWLLNILKWQWLSHLIELLIEDGVEVLPCEAELLHLHFAHLGFWKNLVGQSREILWESGKYDQWSVHTAQPGVKWIKTVMFSHFIIKLFLWVPLLQPPSYWGASTLRVWLSSLTSTASWDARTMSSSWE